QSIVDTLVKNDPNNLTTYTQFQTSLTAPISSGGGPGSGSPGLLTLQTARLAYYKTTPEYNYATPTIGNYIADLQNRFVGDSIWISVKLSNQNNAFVGYRKNKYTPFTYQTLYDDGLHHDGLAGDSIYGAFIIAQTRKTQFYIYAENNLIGLFSPRRAEFEYYSLEVNEKIAAIQKGDVVINEFMSSNQSTVKDTTDDKYEDWVELYNNTNQSVDLSKLFITDDDANIEKFEIPSGVSIPANGRLIIWCDEDSQTQVGVHANFKLSASGEKLIFTRQDGLVLDSLSFGAIPTDQSMERCPDGTGTFKITSKPTFDLPNCGIVANEDVDRLVSLFVSPNPTHHAFEIMNPDGVSIRDIKIYNQLGQILVKTSGSKVDVSNWKAGIYFIVVVDTSLKTYNLKLIKE
ncbi:MAG TPA: lamin tail domain-containing protein, partial [Saprospiraceae bacterium]|nr:lamin tail domain-containing protein [Saprospiraceae bacterium]